MKCIATEKGYAGATAGLVQVGQVFEFDCDECPPWAEEVTSQATAAAGNDASTSAAAAIPDVEEMTKAEIVAKLDEMTVGYNPKDKKDVLYNVLQAELANQGDGDILLAIQKVNTFKDLYGFQVDGRSSVVDNAINKRGMELVNQAADAAEPPVNAPVDLSGAPANTTLGG